MLMGNWSLNFNSDENQDTQDIGCKMFCMGVALNLENLVTLAILPYIYQKQCVKLRNIQVLSISLKTHRMLDFKLPTKMTDI